MDARDRFGWSEARVRVAGADLGVLTAWPREPVAHAGDLARVYDDLAGRLRVAGHALVHEKAFGDLALAPALAEARRAAFVRAGLGVPGPHTFVQGRPCLGGAFAGLQAWTVGVGADVALDPADGEPEAARVVTTGLGRLLFASALTGLDATRDAAPAEELRRMFERADALLTRNGFTFRDTARTWLFVDRLLDVYDDLNRVRSAFFRELGLIEGTQPAYLPASTGIQGRHPSGAACILDFLAVQSRDGSPCRQPIRSARQDAAFHYGSAFSRGMRLGTSPGALLTVSGTASIARDGRTLYVGDPQGQLAETYLDVAAVLRAEGAGLRDVVAAIRYHKDPETWRAYGEMRDLGLLPDQPGIDVWADVCRCELLFEVEAVAVGPAS
jgi:enamine deaminase RidA (YjgF/YER057c/UK114 family)